MFDNYQIFDKYSRFLNSWRKKGSPQLYVATMDIRKCYDSVSIDRMIQMIKEEKFFQEIYMIHNFTKVIRSKRYIFSKEPPKEKAGKYNRKYQDKKRMAKNKSSRYNQRCGSFI